MGIRKRLNKFLKNTIYGNYGALGKLDYIWPIIGKDNQFYVYVKGLKQSVWEQEDPEYMGKLNKLGREYGIVLHLHPEIFKTEKVS